MFAYAKLGETTRQFISLATRFSLYLFVSFALNL